MASPEAKTKMGSPEWSKITFMHDPITLPKTDLSSPSSPTFLPELPGPRLCGQAELCCSLLMGSGLEACPRGFSTDPWIGAVKDRNAVSPHPRSAPSEASYINRRAMGAPGRQLCRQWTFRCAPSMPGPEPAVLCEAFGRGAGQLPPPVPHPPLPRLAPPAPDSLFQRQL